MSIQPFMPGFESEQRRRDLSQFYTPPHLAARLIDWARERAPWPKRVLEPSAGRGALVCQHMMLSSGASEIVAYEVDPENVTHLRDDAAKYTPFFPSLTITVRDRDFLADPDVLLERFELCVKNPPFEDNQDIAFMARACQVSDVVCGIYPARIVHSSGRAEHWRWHDIVREAILTERPQFGGEHSPMTDFVVLDVVRRQYARKQGEATATQVEWW